MSSEPILEWFSHGHIKRLQSTGYYGLAQVYHWWAYRNLALFATKEWKTDQFGISKATEPTA